MDLWFVLLLVVLLIGVMGWPIASLFTNCVLWVCDVNDGEPIDWGKGVAWLYMYPAAIIFSIIEIAILYCD